MSTPFSIEEVSFGDLPGWREDDPARLFPPMAAVLSHLRKGKPYKTGELGITAAELVTLLEAAACGNPDTRTGAGLLRDQLCPFQNFGGKGKRGFVTAFYEPN